MPHDYYTVNVVPVVACAVGILVLSFAADVWGAWRRWRSRR